MSKGPARNRTARKSETRGEAGGITGSTPRKLRSAEEREAHACDLERYPSMRFRVTGLRRIPLWWRSGQTERGRP